MKPWSESRHFCFLAWLVQARFLPSKEWHNVEHRPDRPRSPSSLIKNCPIRLLLPKKNGRQSKPLRYNGEIPIPGMRNMPYLWSSRRKALRWRDGAVRNSMRRLLSGPVPTWKDWTILSPNLKTPREMYFRPMHSAEVLSAMWWPTNWIKTDVAAVVIVPITPFTTLCWLPIRLTTCWLRCLWKLKALRPSGSIARFPRLCHRESIVVRSRWKTEITVCLPWRWISKSLHACCLPRLSGLST